MLTLWQLYVVGFLIGICTVFFDVAYQSYLPSLVERDQIIDGNSKLEISRSAAQIGGPGFAGALVEIFTAPYAVLVDAISFLGSGLFLLGIRKHEERSGAGDGRRPQDEPLDGARRKGCGSSSGTRTSERRRAAPRPPTCSRASRSRSSSSSSSASSSSRAGVIGIVFSIGAAGSLVAAFTATRLSRRFGIGPTTIASRRCFGPATLLVAFAPVGNAAIPFLIAAQLVFCFSVVVYNIVQVSYRQAICPPRLQGRMNSVMRFIVWGTIPIGTLAGGALGTWIGLRETIVDRSASAAASPSSGSCSPRSATSATCPSRSRRSPARPSSAPRFPASPIRSPPPTAPDMRAWPRGGLWRHPDFLKLWSAETISQLGSQVTLLALPLAAILVLDASTFEVACVGLLPVSCRSSCSRFRRACGSTACHGGPMLIVGDFGRARRCSVSLPIAYVARRADPAAAVRRRVRRRRADGLLRRRLPVVPSQRSSSETSIIEGNCEARDQPLGALRSPGRGSAELLVGALTARYAILVDALSFLGLGALLARIRQPEDGSVADRETGAEDRACGAS